MNPVKMRGFRNQRIARCKVNGGVESPVCVDHGFDVVTLRRAAALRDQRFIELRTPLCSKTRGEGIERAADLVQMGDPGGIERGDKKSAPRRVLHESVLLQQSQRLQNG